MPDAGDWSLQATDGRGMQFRLCLAEDKLTVCVKETDDDKTYFSFKDDGSIYVSGATKGWLDANIKKKKFPAEILCWKKKCAPSGILNKNQRWTRTAISSLGNASAAWLGGSQSQTPSDEAQ